MLKSIISARTFAVVIVCAAGVLAVATADAQEQMIAPAALPAVPTLKRAAIVDADVVTLGDLVEPCGQACATPLFRAPAPGQAGTIQAVRVAIAAREAGLGKIDSAFTPQVVITRTGRQASREEIDLALAQAIASRSAMDASDLSLTLDQAHPKLALAASSEQAPMVTDLAFDTRSRRFSASLVAPQGGVTHVSGSYVETILTPVLKRAVQRGDVVQTDDIVFERRDRETFGDESPISAKLAVGRVARVALRTGAVLRDRDLAKQILVERNMPVSMTLESGGLQLTLKGKAMDSGALGDVVSVQNLNSKRTLQGVVTGPGQARIQHMTAPVARTAAAQ